MRQAPGRAVVVLVALAGALASLASAAGVILRGDLGTQAFTTVRGDVVQILTGGIYRFNGEAVAAEGIGWDAVTLLAVVPTLFVTLPALQRASVRATLLTTGILAYLLYQYAEYAMFLAYGPMFLLYVAIFALSASGIVILVSHLDIAALSSTISAGFPRRAAAGYGAFIAVLLTGLWLPAIATSANVERVPALAGATTMVVQAFDLGFLVPLGLFTAFTVWRRMPVGYVLAAVVVVKGAALGAGIAMMMVIESVVTGVPQWPPIILFAVVSLVSLALATRIYRSIAPGSVLTDPATPGRHIATGPAHA